VLSAELVEDGATDPHADVILEALIGGLDLAAHRVPQTAHASGDQVVAQHVAGKLPLETTGNLAHEGRIELNQLCIAHLRTKTHTGVGGLTWELGGHRICRLKRTTHGL